MTYLGKQVGGGQVRPLEAKITSFPVPTTRRELRRFLGMTGYYRGFCRNFSSVAAPMTDLISPLVSLSGQIGVKLPLNAVKHSCVMHQ